MYSASAVDIAIVQKLAEVRQIAGSVEHQVVEEAQEVLELSQKHLLLLQNPLQYLQYQQLQFRLLRLQTYPSSSPHLYHPQMILTLMMFPLVRG